MTERLIIDNSAVLALMFKEPGHEPLQQHLEDAEWSGIGAPTVVESSLVLCARLGQAGKSLLARFLQEADLEIVNFTSDHWGVAANAFITYGKGRHPAALNFGDCMAYAVSKQADLPLLCVGDDFPATDLEVVPPRPSGGDTQTM